ncbi:MAG: helix-turn-helix domain-containing protein [Dehalococcoidia bacterium]
MNRRIWSTEEKTAIVLEMIKGGESMAAVCTRHGVSVAQACRWQEQFLAGGRAALVDRRGRKGRGRVEDEDRRLKELVGEQALTNQSLLYYAKTAGGRRCH